MAGDAKCKICNHRADNGYRRVVNGKITEMCCDPVHKPYLHGNAANFYADFHKKTRRQKLQARRAR